MATSTMKQTNENDQNSSSTSSMRDKTMKELMSDIDKDDPNYKKIFLERFRAKLASDTTGHDDL